MTTQVLFVRAVNVGGGGKLPMAEFRELLSELGATDVRTYIASGNAVLSLAGDASSFAREVESALTARYGWVRDVMVRTPGQLVEALAAHPFDVVDARYSYVSFLAGRPTREAVEKARDVATGEDRWEVIGDDLHIRYEHGAGSPSMNTDAVMRRLGVPGTARNLNTVSKLISLAG